MSGPFLVIAGLVIALVGCLHLALAETTIERLEACATLAGAAVVMALAWLCRKPKP